MVLIDWGCADLLVRLWSAFCGRLMYAHAAAHASDGCLAHGHRLQSCCIDKTTFRFWQWGYCLAYVDHSDFSHISSLSVKAKPFITLMAFLYFADFCLVIKCKWCSCPGNYVLICLCVKLCCWLWFAMRIWKCRICCEHDEMINESPTGWIYVGRFRRWCIYKVHPPLLKWSARPQ